MKILVFEYITGGGFCREDLPKSLAAEGLLMLKALLRDLSALDVEPVFLLDVRLSGEVGAIGGNAGSVVHVEQTDDINAILQTHMDYCDAVWLLAPEMDNVLLNLTRMVERHGKILLSSPSAVVELTSDKYKTFQHLTAHDIPAVPTEFLNRWDFYKIGGQRHVLKPFDGMGCVQTFIIDSGDDFEQVKLELDGPERYIVQPFVEGQSKSLSCLFRNGKGWLLSINGLAVQVEGRKLTLSLCRVNVSTDTNKYQSLTDRIARAIPGLWGYAGIDFIENSEGIAVLEINPRLTTSYAGIRQARGLNVAEQTVSMLKQDPVLKFTQDRLITVSVTKGVTNAS